MRDFPIFETQYGVASLTLRQIPYRQQAFIRLLSSLQPEKLLEECISFCRACGAERISAAGDGILERYPKTTTILSMQRDLAGLPKADACLFPVTEKTVQQWLDIYNDRMAEVDNAAYLDSRDGKELLESGCGYFVHRDGKLLGIGKSGGDRIEAVICVERGCGESVLLALAELLTGDTVQLQVADTNARAIRLYECLGFVKTREVDSWYRVL